MSRRGITLVEVLVAIFVMGLGMIALLALFPLGALTMAQAIKDDRTGHAAANATATFKTWNIGHNSVYWSTTAASNQYVTPIAPLAGANFPPLTGSTRSYPLYIDPIGVLAQLGSPLPAPPPPPPNPVIGNIARVLPSNAPMSVTTTNIARRWFSFLDDIAFNLDDPGDPTFTNGILAANFNREGRYSWAYLCRMPVANDFALVSSQIDMAVVVYSGRSLQLSATLSNISETAYGGASTAEPGPVTFILPNRIQIQWATTKPKVRKGGWILDDRMPTLIANPAVTEPQGYFYRVVNVTDIAANVVELELQTTLRWPLTQPPVGQPQPTGSVVVLDNVVEVFERGAYVPQY